MDHKQYSWGYELCYADTSLYSAYIFVIKEGEQTPYQYHKNRDKTIFVLQGTVNLRIEGNNKMLSEGEKYHISPKIMHRISALKDEAIILEAGTKLEDDIVIVEE